MIKGGSVDQEREYSSRGWEEVVMIRGRRRVGEGGSVYQCMEVTLQFISAWKLLYSLSVHGSYFTVYQCMEVTLLFISAWKLLYSLSVHGSYVTVYLSSTSRIFHSYDRANKSGLLLLRIVP